MELGVNPTIFAASSSRSVSQVHTNLARLWCHCGINKTKLSSLHVPRIIRDRVKTSNRALPHLGDTVHRIQHFSRIGHLSVDAQTSTSDGLQQVLIQCTRWEVVEVTLGCHFPQQLIQQRLGILDSLGKQVLLAENVLKCLIVSFNWISLFAADSQQLFSRVQQHFSTVIGLTFTDRSFGNIRIQSPALQLLCYHLPFIRTESRLLVLVKLLEELSDSCRVFLFRITGQNVVTPSFPHLIWVSPQSLENWCQWQPAGAYFEIEKTLGWIQRNVVGSATLGIDVGRYFAILLASWINPRVKASLRT